MRGSTVAVMLGCIIGTSGGTAMAQESAQPAGVGGRVEVAEVGFAVMFPDDWVWYRTPVADTRAVMDAYAAVADPAFAEVFEEFILFNESDWLDEYGLFGEEDWFEELVGISAHPSSGVDGGSPYDRCDVATLHYESLDDYVDEQLDFWEQFGQELYPEGMEITKVVLPAGEAVRMDTFESSEYAVLGAMGGVRLYCFGLDVPEDRWLSIAATLDRLE